MLIDIITYDIRKTKLLIQFDMFRKGDYITCHPIGESMLFNVEGKQRKIKKVKLKKGETADDVLFIGRRESGVEAYLKEDVRKISDGEKFCMLADYLESAGYKVETDENMFVKKAIYK